MPLSPSLSQTDEAMRLAAVRAFGAARYYRDHPEGRSALEVVYKMLAILTPVMPTHVVEAADAMTEVGV